MEVAHTRDVFGELLLEAQVQRAPREEERLRDEVGRRGGWRNRRRRGAQGRQVFRKGAEAFVEPQERRGEGDLLRLLRVVDDEGFREHEQQQTQVKHEPVRRHPHGVRPLSFGGGVRDQGVADPADDGVAGRLPPAKERVDDGDLVGLHGVQRTAQLPMGPHHLLFIRPNPVRKERPRALCVNSLAKDQPEGRALLYLPPPVLKDRHGTSECRGWEEEILPGTEKEGGWLVRQELSKGAGRVKLDLAESGKRGRGVKGRLESRLGINLLQGGVPCVEEGPRYLLKAILVVYLKKELGEEGL
mmetsp:Transcript_38547/g.52243  ORF Transcript_38547/g.52243 Transcript_38547/m.52243 type:complete len:301 (-) Transcript_38547:858-1760(-)